MELRSNYSARNKAHIGTSTCGFVVSQRQQPAVGSLDFDTASHIYSPTATDCVPLRDATSKIREQAFTAINQTWIEPPTSRAAVTTTDAWKGTIHILTWSIEFNRIM
jgi:hypothetical protein